MSYEEYSDVTRLDGFDVVAIGDAGVFVADSDGNCWRVASDEMLASMGGELADAYAEATQ